MTTGQNPAAAGLAVADPGPLGLAAFAATTFMLSVINTNMVGGSMGAAVLGLALFYGGAAQLLAGMWEFVKGNTFGAVAFTSFGAFWLSYWYLVDHVLPRLEGSASDIGHAVGLYLLTWTIFTAFMTVAAARVSVAVLSVFIVLTVTFLALCVGELAAAHTATRIGGWLGIVTALLAWYAAFAAVVNATYRRTVLPTFPTAPLAR
ncbi:acetate uptake transporter [Nocardia nova]|uniref:acetate uptake transporter n=1 Tax=Nocardia nova TaxID=37330 RepID=UPI0033DB85CA